MRLEYDLPGVRQSESLAPAVASVRVVQAENYDAAVAIARECPGHTIELREFAGYA